MDKRAIALGALVGTGVAVVCVPDIKAYRRLGAITRSVRSATPPDPPAAPPVHEEPAL